MKGTHFHLNPPRLPGEFLNREKQLTIGERELKELRRRATHFKVLEVHGYGGMGKTRLLKRLREVAEAGSPPDSVIWVPLEADAHATELGPLIRMRDQLNFECLLFDTALITFWHATGQRQHLELSSRLARSLPVQAFQSASMAAGAPLPFTVAIEAFNYAKRKLAEMGRYHREEFEAIDELWETPGTIRSSLPTYLGIDIERGLGEHGELLAFYDGYEKQRPVTRDSPNPWLRELLSTLQRGVHVISTRERLPWKALGEGVVEQVDVSELPEAQSVEMIEARLGDLDELVMDHLLETSHRIPFFLEAVVESYERRLQAGKTLSLESLPTSPEGSVDHLLEHLPAEMRKLIVMLAVIQVFDEYVFDRLIEKFRFSSEVPPFDHCVNEFFIEEVGPDLYKTHDLLTEFIRDSSAVEATKRDALEAITEDLPLRFRSSELADPHTLLASLGAVVSGWYSMDDAPSSSIEALVDAGYLLYDAGYWNELGSLPLSEGHPAAVAVEFFSILGVRRNEGPKVALRLFEGFEDRIPTLGRHARSAELEIAYLTELTGKYTEARERFDDLEKRVLRFDPTDRLHLRLRLYHADMLTMDGRFQEASRLLLETYENDGVSMVDWIELVRHRGHAFRFSFLFETAEQLYGQALQGAEEIESTPLQGKLWTNLAEARCWHDPHRALEAASRSSELNIQVDNRIELAKCEAARAIAWANLGEKDRAEQALAKARRYTDGVGYPAGTAFASQAECILHGLSAEIGVLQSTLSDLEGTVGDLGTYSHLRVMPVWLTRSEVDFAAAAGEFEWLEPETLEARLHDCLNG
jgi:tetratricopeptide (TPR) repeat protein